MAGRLKPLDVEREKRPGKYADGGGLYLIVTGPTAKNWSFRYWFRDKERWHGLGSFKDVSLRDARLARDAARLRVKGDRNAAGVDIVAEKRAARKETQAARSRPPHPRSGNAQRVTSTSTGRRGARSTGISGLLR